MGKVISQKTIEQILDITENHPYYVNILCRKLWLLDNPPNEKDIEEVWRQYAFEERANVLNEIDLLSPNQIKMLISIAKYREKAFPMSKEFLVLANFSLSSASQAIKSLKQKDYLYVNNEGKYCIIDPLIKYIFSQ